jgi:hypothetical protein
MGIIIIDTLGTLECWRRAGTIGNQQDCSALQTAPARRESIERSRHSTWVPRYI